MVKGCTSPCFKWIPAGMDPLAKVSPGCWVSPALSPREEGTGLDASRIPCAGVQGCWQVCGGNGFGLKPHRALVRVPPMPQGLLRDNK